MDQQTADIRYTQWTQIVSEANLSSLSKRAWCREHGIKEKSFYYWQRKIRKDTASSMNTSAEVSIPPHADLTGKSSFVELSFHSSEVSEGSTPSPSDMVPEMMLQLGDCRMYLTGAIREQTLRTVMKVIRDA